MFWAFLASIGLSAQELPSLDLSSATATRAMHRGKQAIRIQSPPDGNIVVPLKDIRFTDGEVEVELSGEPGPGAAAAARGFVGIAFRTQSRETYECIYIRPTNGRAPDQVRRNHSIQYVSEPEWPWMRLRKEFPEKYESYADMQPGEFQRYRIVVEGASAKLYLNGAEQPNLIVNDLRLGVHTGGIALWAGPGTVAHFANLKVVPKR
jgi:hypothetical protein